MPDLLILGNDTDSAEELEELGKAAGFRVKTSYALDPVMGWLESKDFDALFVHSNVSLDLQKQIADQLWKRNPLALFLLYNIDCLDPSKFSAHRLFGAQLALGPKAFEVASKALQRVTPRGFVRSDDVKILVVEDLDSPRDIICAYIEKMGYPKVEGVGSAEEALNALNQLDADYSCVITDLKMPNVGGRELIEKLRNDSKLCSLPIIVLTAHGSIDALVDCLRAGASGFLTKPPKKADLLKEIQKAIRISTSGASPRLVQPDQADLVIDLLIEQGI